jgi:hypothetical protein
MIKYSTPEMEVIAVSTEDIILASETNKGEFDDEEV